MDKFSEIKIPTKYGEKSISVYFGDVTEFEEEIDILTVSAFYRSYNPTPRTIMYALEQVGISLLEMSCEPQIDLRNLCNIWLTKAISKSDSKIKRIGCIDMSPYRFEGDGWKEVQQEMLKSIRAYFQMLDIASVSEIPIATISMPLLGAGRQGIPYEFTIMPILNECIDFLKRNSEVKRIVFIEKNAQNAFQLGLTVNHLYSVHKDSMIFSTPPQHQKNDIKKVFISYSSKNKEIADSLCSKLESKHLEVWYAPRNVQNDYASAIVSAISNCTHFVVIISRDSLHSQHVLNEIDLAFKGLDKNIKIMPLRIDREELPPAFEYYLSRQHWAEAYTPPVEERLKEFAQKVFDND